MLAKSLSTLTVCLLLCGCIVVRQEQEQEAHTDVAVGAAVNAAVEHCKDMYREGVRAVALERAKCFNDALGKLRPLKRSPDLLDVDAANRLAVAGKEQKGRITHIDAMEQFAAMRAKVIAEEERRLATNPTAGGQGLSASSMPVACTRFGDTATCY